jgi:hypothetical protein
MINASQPKRAELSAIITRADGTVEDLGVIAAWHKHWWMRLWYHIKGIKGKFNTLPGN